MRLRAGAAVLALLASETVQAQVADSTPRFSVFAGTMGSNGGLSTRGWRYPEYGVSADFHAGDIEQTLRANLTYRHGASSMKVGTLSLDVVGKPLPSLFRMQPYVLGGFGVSTVSGYSAFVPITGSFDPPMTVERTVSAMTWAFVEAGGGLEIGRHFFIQTKIMLPVAGTGTTQYPLSAGFRFSY